MDDLRRAYQRAVSVPLLNVEQLWREWDSYENGLNRVTVSNPKIVWYESCLTIFKQSQTDRKGSELISNVMRTVSLKDILFKSFPLDFWLIDCR